MVHYRLVRRELIDDWFLVGPGDLGLRDRLDLGVGDDGIGNSGLGDNGLGERISGLQRLLHALDRGLELLRCGRCAQDHLFANDRGAAARRRPLIGGNLVQLGDPGLGDDGLRQGVFIVLRLDLDQRLGRDLQRLDDGLSHLGNYLVRLLENAGVGDRRQLHRLGLGRHAVGQLLCCRWREGCLQRSGIEAHRQAFRSWLDTWHRGGAQIEDDPRYRVGLGTILPDPHQADDVVSDVEADLLRGLDDSRQIEHEARRILELKGRIPERAITDDLHQGHPIEGLRSDRDQLTGRDTVRTRHGVRIVGAADIGFGRGLVLPRRTVSEATAC